MTSIKRIYYQQEEFQNLLDNDQKEQGYINKNLLALTSEIGEVADETDWKAWKQNDKDKEAFQEEVADCFLFVLNLVQATDLDINEFLAEVHEKQKKNLERFTDEDKFKQTNLEMFK